MKLFDYEGIVHLNNVKCTHISVQILIRNLILFDFSGLQLKQL